jgi:hypothetical protein
MSTNLVPFADQERMAQAIAKSGLFGLKDMTQVLALMAVAQAEGRHPASVAKDYHIIQGRPALKADAILARFQEAGGRVEWKTYTDDEVTGVFTHAQGGSLSVTWTLKNAKAIGLAGKDNWAKYPRAMLRARVISEGVRSVYPAVLVGEYTPEEVQDFTPPRSAPPPEPERITEIIEAETVDGIPLYVPAADGNASLYDMCASFEDWRARYDGLVQKVKANKKLDEAEKEEKLHRLKQVNATQIEQMLEENA